MFEIRDDLKAFLESGVSVMLATASPHGRPHCIPAWGPRITGPRRLEVCVENPRAERALDDLRQNPKAALIFGSPVSYRSIQLKGTYFGERPASDSDDAWVERHWDAFLVETALVGDAPHAVRPFFMRNASRTLIEIEVQSAFDQTPGPSAGAPL